MNDSRIGIVTEILVNQGMTLALIRAEFLYLGGGGQPCDRATIQQNFRSLPIKDTKEINGQLYWIIPEPGLETGPIEIIRDDEWRQELSQQHTAQHIFSGLALKRFGWKSDGFCIAEKESKIELLGADLDSSKYDLLEKETNLVILHGLPVLIYETKAGDAIRKVENPYHTRVVEIKDIDKCYCGGTHVQKTDQIGSFAIQEVHRKNKEAVRVIFVSGLRLSKIVKSYTIWERNLKNKLKGDIDERIDILLREMDVNRENEKELIKLLGDMIPAEKGLFERDDLPLSPDALKYLSLAINRRGITSSLINREGYFVVSGPDSGKIVEELKQRGAKGGGKEIITGRLPILKKEESFK